MEFELTDKMLRAIILKRVEDPTDFTLEVVDALGLDNERAIAHEAQKELMKDQIKSIVATYYSKEAGCDVVAIPLESWEVYLKHFELEVKNG